MPLNQSNTLASRTVSRSPISRSQTSGAIPVPSPKWKAYEPHTPAWFAQALQRYANERAMIIEAQDIAQDDSFFCFYCHTIHHLFNVFVNGDRSSTFRYCQTCIDSIKQSGTDVTVMQPIEEPIEEPDEEPENVPLFDLPDDSAYNSKQTIRLPIIPQEDTAAAPGGMLALIFTGRANPFFYIGSTLFIVMLIWTIISFGPDTLNTIRYGSPPVTQVDAVVGHGGDSITHPSHFIAINNKGTIVVIEWMAGDPSNTKSYTVARTTSTTTPAFVTFDAATHPNMIVRIGDTLYPLQNDGKEFKSN